MTSTWVCFAVREECAPFKRRVREREDVRVLISGMGARNATRLFNTALLRERPNRVITCGFAGALRSDLNIGDVLFECEPELGCHEMLKKLGATPARFHCSDRVAVSAAEKSNLRQSTGADAVEMESGVIRRLCRDQGIPAITIRAISDRADEDLPLDFNRLLTSDSRLSPIRLAAALARSPGAVPQLFKLRQNCTAAAQQLSDVLCGLLNVP